MSKLKGSGGKFGHVDAVSFIVDVGLGLTKRALSERYEVSLYALEKCYIQKLVETETIKPLGAGPGRVHGDDVRLYKDGKLRIMRVPESLKNADRYEITEIENGIQITAKPKASDKTPPAEKEQKASAKAPSVSSRRKKNA